MKRLLALYRPGDLVALGAGAALPLAFAPFHLFYVAWLVPAVLFAVWRQVSPRRAFWRGYLAGLGMFGVGVSWVFVAIHDFGNTAAPVAVLLTALFVGFIALYPALTGYLVAHAAAWCRRQPALQLLVVLPALWVLVEWLRGWLFTGFPWLELGYSQIDTPLRGLAPVLGVYGLSWASAFCGGAILLMLLGGRVGRFAGPLLVALPIGLGGWLHQQHWVQPAGPALKVSLIQGNLPQLTKWDSDKIQQRLQSYAELARSRFGRVDVEVWPENAITVFYHDVAQDYFKPLADEARSAGTDLVLGVPLLDPDGERYYTTMMSLGSHHGFYRKQHLVPFGEYVPLAGLLRGLIGFFDLPMSGFSPGPAGQAPLQVAGNPAAVSICYEDAFGTEISQDLPAARLLINGSNNAWYGDSLAPHQHLQISRMRAVETGRPLLRATTNGISALVDSDGNILARSQQFRQEILDGEIQPMAGETPFVRYGNAIIPVLALLLMPVLLLCRRASLKRRTA